MDAWNVARLLGTLDEFRSKLDSRQRRFGQGDEYALIDAFKDFVPQSYDKSREEREWSNGDYHRALYFSISTIALRALGEQSSKNDAIRFLAFFCENDESLRNFRLPFVIARGRESVDLVGLFETMTAANNAECFRRDCVIVYSWCYNPSIPASDQATARTFEQSIILLARKAAESSLLADMILYVRALDRMIFCRGQSFDKSAERNSLIMLLSCQTRDECFDSLKTVLKSVKLVDTYRDMEVSNLQELLLGVMFKIILENMHLADAPIDFGRERELAEAIFDEILEIPDSLVSDNLMLRLVYLSLDIQQDGLPITDFARMAVDKALLSIIGNNKVSTLIHILSYKIEGRRAVCLAMYTDQRVRNYVLEQARSANLHAVRHVAYMAILHGTEREEFYRDLVEVLSFNRRRFANPPTDLLEDVFEHLGTIAANPSLHRISPIYGPQLQELFLAIGCDFESVSPAFRSHLLNQLFLASRSHEEFFSERPEFEDVIRDAYLYIRGRIEKFDYRSGEIGPLAYHVGRHCKLMIGFPRRLKEWTNEADPSGWVISAGICSVTAICACVRDSGIRARVSSPLRFLNRDLIRRLVDYL